jgi:hypothetical protein
MSVDSDILLPDQYADLLRRSTLIEGEEKLMLAVLDDAIRCYLRNVNSKSGKRRGDFIEVKKWFQAGGGEVGSWRVNVFSFENLCATLGLEPPYVLARLRTLTIEDLPARRSPSRRLRSLSSLRDVNRRRRRGRPRIDS